jgi:hypothetical protein
MEVELGWPAAHKHRADALALSEPGNSGFIVGWRSVPRTIDSRINPSCDGHR